MRFGGVVLITDTHFKAFVVACLELEGVGIEDRRVSGGRRGFAGHITVVDKQIHERGLPVFGVSQRVEFPLTVNAVFFIGFEVRFLRRFDNDLVFIVERVGVADFFAKRLDRK